MLIRAAGVAAIAVACLQPLEASPSVEHNRPYVSDGTPDQVLDLSTPEAAGGFATLLFIHGGSLQEDGERRSSPPYARVCEPFLAAGMACASIDYRLAPTHRWPAMPNDVAAAFRWVKDRVTTLGGDPRRIFVFGHSSGCQLAATLGANPKYLASVGLAPSDVAGIVAMGCVLAPLEDIAARVSMDDLRQRWPLSRTALTFESLEDWLDSDPSRFVGPHMPPTLIVVAKAERFFPAVLEQGAKFVRRLLEAGRPADLAVVAGRHMTSVANIWREGDPTFAAIHEFIERPSAAGSDSR